MENQRVLSPVRGMFARPRSHVCLISGAFAHQFIFLRICEGPRLIFRRPPASTLRCGVACCILTGKQRDLLWSQVTSDSLVGCWHQMRFFDRGRQCHRGPMAWATYAEHKYARTGLRRHQQCTAIPAGGDPIERVNATLTLGILEKLIAFATVSSQSYLGTIDLT